MMKKILTIIIFALAFNGFSFAKEAKKTSSVRKGPSTVLYDVPKIGKTATKNSNAKNTKTKEIKAVAKAEQKKSNKSSIAQPESKKLLAKNNKKNNKNATKTIKLEKTQHNEKVLVKKAPSKLNLPASTNYISFSKTGKTISFVGNSKNKQVIKLAPNTGVKDYSSNAEIFPNDGQRQAVIKIAKSLIGTPYRYGSMNPKRGFDCSGFTSYVYLQKGIKLPRSSADQFAQLAKVSKPQAGDLVFFRHGKKIGHVGMYLGNGMMVHSPQSGDRVKIESMEKPNWKRRYAGARKAISSNTNTMIAFNK